MAGSIMAGETTAVKFVKNKRDWFERWKTFHMVAFIGLRTIEIIAAASIPLWAMVSTDKNSKVISSALAAVILVSQGLLEMLGSRQKWKSYVGAGQALAQALGRFEDKAPPYNGTDGVSKFWDHIDVIMQSDFDTWSKLIDASANPSQPQKPPSST